MASLCRDCLTEHRPDAAAPRCPACRSPRLLAHPELPALAIAHLDCDAFYASVEKRDDPALRDRPVIVGGGGRGVVTTACYIARIRGVRSAMPMFKALKLCPDAAIVKPRMAHYVAVSRQIRARLDALTPLVEPLSLDEAFLDLSGTERLHGASPALTLARLQREIERELGLTVSVGLSHNKFLAKIASEQDKPRGFRVVGRAETLGFLAGLPVSAIWGVGPATHAALEADGIRSIADLRARGHDHLLRRFGALGDRLHRLARGEDARAVSPDRVPKTISNETTFNADLADLPSLERELWRLTEKLAARAKAGGLGGWTVALKLKRADHRILTRRCTLDAPTQIADRIFRAARPMLHRDMTAAPFRLIGIGLSTLVPAGRTYGEGDLLDPTAARRAEAERATDRIRARFGDESIRLGRGLP